MSIKNERVTYYHWKDNKRSHQSRTRPGDLGDFDSDPREEIRVTALKAPLPLLGFPPLVRHPPLCVPDGRAEDEVSLC